MVWSMLTNVALVQYLRWRKDWLYDVMEMMLTSRVTKVRRYGCWIGAEWEAMPIDFSVGKAILPYFTDSVPASIGVCRLSR